LALILELADGWRAIDQDGSVRDQIVRIRRNTKVAKQLPTRLLQEQGIKPRRIIADELGWYAAATEHVMPDVDHRSHTGEENRTENSRVPFRKPERIVQHSRSACALQRCVSIVTAFRNPFVQPATNAPPDAFISTGSKLSRKEICCCSR
jgi:putative transposase